ncbi:MAG: ATP-binding protein, partial [Natronomonas sp.]
MSDIPATEDTGIEYLQITPTPDRLDPRTVTSEFRRLQQLRVPNDDASWLARLVSGSPEPPVIEWLLVTDGTADGALTYCVGVSEPSLLDLLETICQVLFPKAYEIDRLDTHPLSVLPVVTSDDDGLGIETRDDDPAIAAVTYQGVGDRRRDWQTHLTQFAGFTADEETALPLSRLVETLVKSGVPMAFQTLLRPKPEWTDEAVNRRIDLELGRDTPADRVIESLLGRATRRGHGHGHGNGDDDTKPTGDVALRLADLDSRDTRRSFIVTARAVGVGVGVGVGVDPEPSTDGDEAPESRTDLEATLAELTTAFAPLDGEFHRIEATMSTGDAAKSVLEAMVAREPAAQQYDRLVTKLPLVANRSPGIVADVTEAPGFCLLDGTAHTALAERGLAPTPGERSSVTRPPDDILATYRTEGFALGRPLDTDRTATPERLHLPPSLQPLHMAWFGKTGSGKSTSLVTAILDNQAATDGADILIDPKGDGMADTYLRTHYARHGTLENVYYFDCTRVLPALSFFDIRSQLDAGIDRTTAIEDVVDHYVDILKGIMGRERFERAVRSPDIIRYLCKALFDPIHGNDAFTHAELQAATARLHDSRTAPAVSDDELQRMLNGLVTNSKRSFDELMQGVANRIEKIPIDPRLGALFNYVPTDD